MDWITVHYREQRNDALCFASTRKMMPSALPSRAQVPYPAHLCPKILAGALFQEHYLLLHDQLCAIRSVSTLVAICPKTGFPAAMLILPSNLKHLDPQ